MNRNRRRLYWALGAAVVALVSATSATTVAYSKWWVGQTTLASEHTAITLVEEREEIRDGKAKYIFVFDIVFPEDCEFNLVSHESSVHEDRWLGSSEQPGRNPHRNVRLTVTHFYDHETATTGTTQEMVANGGTKKLVFKSAGTNEHRLRSGNFVVTAYKPKVVLLPTKPEVFPADMLVISTQSAPPGAVAAHQLVTLIRISGPGGSVPDVGEAELDVIAREYRAGGAKNNQ